MDSLKLVLEELIAIKDEDWLIFKSKLKNHEFKAREVIVRQGNVATSIYYVARGLLRTYHLKDGKEINTYFACDGQFISTYSSFITQTPSFEYLETIEDSIIYSLSFHMLTALYGRSSKFEKLGRILAEKNYLCVLDRTMAMQTKTAKEKYLDFMKSYDKKIVQRVPQHQIASFLGMAPESLSRIRKEISIS